MKLRFILWGFYALACFSSCQNHSEAHKEDIKYQVTNPIVLDTTIIQEYIGQVNAIRRIEIRSQERGYLERIYVDEGQFVRKGQLLFQIMPNLYNVEVEKAQAEVKLATIEVENTQLLFDKNVVAPNELALAKAKLAKAKAELSQANTHLQFTKITAPFDGYINRFELKLGSLVDEGELLTSLSDNQQMWVYFNVPEAVYLNYKMKVSEQNLDKVQLELVNGLVFNETGKVETIEADFNNETGNIAFRATFPNPEHLLRHGETGKILMQIPIQKAVIIPQKATVEIMDKRYVYIVDKDHSVKLTPITIAAEMTDLFVVGAGLSGKEHILLEGLNKVKENQKIEFEFLAPQKVMASLKLASE